MALSSETVARTIQLILAPVVMVTACAILLGSLLAYYAAINDRMRLMARERLDLLHRLGAGGTSGEGTGTGFLEERLAQVDTQLPDLLRRHTLAHDAVVAVYCAILMFIASMFVIAVSAVGVSDLLAGVALGVFLVGTVVLLAGVALAIVAVRASDRAVHYEVRRVLGLSRKDVQP